MSRQPLRNRLIGAAAAVILPAAALAAEPVSVLFVGNSYTFGRVEPVMNYNAANVHDLTAAFNADQPHRHQQLPARHGRLRHLRAAPLGRRAGHLQEDDRRGRPELRRVALHAQRGDAARPVPQHRQRAWDLRGNVATQDVGQRGAAGAERRAAARRRGKNANPAGFAAYANQFERFIHVGTAQNYTETELFGSAGHACMATGLSKGSCGITRKIPPIRMPVPPPASTSSRPGRGPTWSRRTRSRPPTSTSPTGAPIVDTSSDPNGVAATLYYGQLAGMTTDMHAAFYGLAASNSGFAGVAPVGDAFQRAVDHGLVLGSGFYQADGTYLEPDDKTIDLWWLDRTHPSRYGSYLSALVLFGTLTGIDPWSLGASEQAAADLGISRADAVKLQQVASEQLYTAGVALTRVPCLHADPHAADAGACR